VHETLFIAIGAADVGYAFRPYAGALSWSARVFTSAWTDLAGSECQSVHARSFAPPENRSAQDDALEC